MPSRVRLDPARLDRAFAVARDLVDAGTFPCAVMAVAGAEGRVGLEAFSGEARIDDHTLFPIASITKAVLAVSVLQLAQAGELTLQAPLRTYLPEFSAPGVTALHLLTHTSGLAEDMDLGEMVRDLPDRRTFLDRACRSALAFAPGTRVAYNTLGFLLLGELVSRVSGTPCAAYQREALFSPLGMDDTTYDPLAHAPGRTMLLDSRDVLPLSREAWTRYEISLAPFDLWSTAVDLVALGRALLGDLRGGGRVLAPAYATLMARDHTAGLAESVGGAPRPVHCGLGWGKAKEGVPGSAEVFQHGGAAGGELWVDPAWDLVYVFLSSLEGRGGLQQLLPLRAVYGVLAEDRNDRR